MAITSCEEKVSWEIVRDSWARDADLAKDFGNHAAGPNEWIDLPGGEALPKAEWRRIKLSYEYADEKMYVIGEAQWKAEFGEDLRVASVASSLSIPRSTLDHHGRRIMDLVDAVGGGQSFEPIILVAPREEDAAIILDGNHRGVAFYKAGNLAETYAFLGTSRDIRLYECYQWLKLIPPIQTPDQINPLTN